MGTLMACFSSYVHVPVGEWRSRASKVRRINSDCRDTHFSSTFGISSLSYSKMGEQACCVLCSIPGDKTSETFDQVSQQTKSLVVAVGV